MDSGGPRDFDRTLHIRQNLTNSSEDIYDNTLNLENPGGEEHSLTINDRPPPMGLNEDEPSRIEGLAVTGARSKRGSGDFLDGDRQRQPNSILDQRLLGGDDFSN